MLVRPMPPSSRSSCAATRTVLSRPDQRYVTFRILFPLRVGHERVQASVVLRLAMENAPFNEQSRVGHWLDSMIAMASSNGVVE